MDLAFHFKIPLYKLLNEMPYDEFCAWLAYYEKRPYGLQDDYRAAMIISAIKPGTPVDKIFPSLAPRAEDRLANSLKGSLLFQKMVSSKGGDKLEF